MQISDSEDSSVTSAAAADEDSTERQRFWDSINQRRLDPTWGIPSDTESEGSDDSPLEIGQPPEYDVSPTAFTQGGPPPVPAPQVPLPPQSPQSAACPLQSPQSVASLPRTSPNRQDGQSKSLRRNRSASGGSRGGQPSSSSRNRILSVVRNRSISRGRAKSSRQPTTEEDDEVNIRTLDPAEAKRLKTRRALRQLRSPPNASTWSPEHRDIYLENVKILLDATKDPSDPGEDSGGSENRRRSAQHSLPIPPAKQGKKRSRSRTLATNPKAETEGPLKRLKTGTQIKVPDLPEDLVKLNQQPLQFNFAPHPLEDRSDDWFVYEFRKLFQRIEKFLDEYYCIHNLDEGDFHQPWAINHTPEFLNYVLQVADQDPGQGGWDKVLRDTNQRKWMLMGILIRILEVKIFDADLWGATKEEKGLMFSIEHALFAQEGFSRTELRSKAVKTILGRRPVTRNFHSEVAKLTARVSLLLKPLTDFMYIISPPEDKSIPLIWDQYQSLHNIISAAAYLHLCIRLSPTIFYFTPLSPNEAFQPDDQHSLENQIFSASKQTVVDSYDALAKPWTKKKSALDEQIKRCAENNLVEEGKQAKANLAAHIANQPKHIGVSHRALVKIAAWPNIRRFKPGSVEQEKLGIPLEQRAGFRIYDVSKSAGVFYFGIENRRERARRSVCLRGHVKERQKKYGAKMEKHSKAGLLALVGMAAVAAVPVYFLSEGVRGLAGEYLGEAVAGLVDLRGILGFEGFGFGA